MKLTGYSFCLRYPKRIAYLILGLLLACCTGIYCQSQSRTDSLESAYSSGGYEEQDKLKILKELAINHTNNEKKLQFSEELILAAGALDSTTYLFQGFQEKGNALRLKSDLSHALESYFEAAKIVGAEKYSRQLGVVYISIADVYSIMGNHQNAVKYHQRALAILREENDSINIASALLNAGDEYINAGNLDSAQMYTMEAETIFKKINSPIGEAYSLGNLGMIFAKLGNDRQAEENMNKAILLLEEMDEFYPIAVYLNFIADIYLEKGDRKTALTYALRSLDLAQRNGMKKQISDANLKLSEIYEQSGKLMESFRYYKDHIAFKDSVNNIVSVQQMADQRADFEISRKQIEVDLLNQQKKTQQIIVIAIIIALFLICLLAFGLFRRYKFIRETNQVIENERNRSDGLLLNILPRETAMELKQNGKVQAKKFESVTVLFTDFKGFTKYAQNASPEKLVESVDFYFSAFDQIMQKFGLEKIKTLGDAYMCAGGLPFPTTDHATKIVLAAIEIVDFVNKTKMSNLDHTFDIRIGINSGPVVAGVVGTKKFAYDIWGDTVNIAARMESSSEPGKINISEHTFELIKESFKCEYRGEIDVKNKGMMNMYFVRGANEETLEHYPS